MSKWVVKDASGAYETVNAEGLHETDRGLTFVRNGAIVAFFKTWLSYRLLEKSKPKKKKGKANARRNKS